MLHSIGQCGHAEHGHGRALDFAKPEDKEYAGNLWKLAEELLGDGEIHQKLAPGIEVCFSCIRWINP